MASPVHLVFGDEYLVSAKAREIVDGILPAADQAFGLEVVDGQAENAGAAVEAVRRCSEAVCTAGFLGARKVVWFRDVGFLVDNAVGRTEAAKTALTGLASVVKSGVPFGTTLVVTAPKADKRYAFFKACKEAGEVHEFAVPDSAYSAARQAEAILQQMLAESGLKMGTNVRAAFLEKVSADTRQMAGEIEKLAVFVGRRTEVTLADIESITSPSRGALAWDLADAVGHRQMGKALIVLGRLLFQRESPIALVMALESRVRDLLIYREAIDRGWLRVKGDWERGTAVWGKLPPEADAVFSGHFEKDPRAMHPYRAGRLAAQARLFSGEALLRCQRLTADAHASMVSGAMPQSMVLELLIVKMLS